MTKSRDSRSFRDESHIPDAAVVELYQLLGEMMVSWNQCEGRLRRLVVRLAGGKQPNDFALTAHASVDGLLELLSILANYAETDAKDHLAHYGECVARLREHYEFLARGIHFVGHSSTFPEAGAWVTYLAGSRGLRPRQERADAPSVRALVANLAAVSAYGRALLIKLSPSDEPAWGARRWPRKPPLADRLNKPAPILLGEPPPHAAAKAASTAHHTAPPPLRPRPD